MNRVACGVIFRRQKLTESAGSDEEDVDELTLIDHKEIMSQITLKQEVSWCVYIFKEFAVTVMHQQSTNWVLSLVPHTPKFTVTQNQIFRQAPLRAVAALLRRICRSANLELRNRPALLCCLLLLLLLLLCPVWCSVIGKCVKMPLATLQGLVQCNRNDYQKTRTMNKRKIHSPWWWYSELLMDCSGAAFVTHKTFSSSSKELVQDRERCEKKGSQTILCQFPLFMLNHYFVYH